MPRSAMRRAWIASVLVLGVVGVAMAAPTPRAAGFDHVVHDRKLVVAGGDSLSCASCHAMNAGQLARPGHASCFGACHGSAPRSAVVGDRAAVCVACHADAGAGAIQPRVPYPPYAFDPDFAIALGHRRHRELPCARCHTASKPAPHARCAGCHDGAATAGHGPAMTACAGCHTPAVGRPLPPTIIPAEINVDGAFSHARHAARGAAGTRCATCHAAVRDTDDNILPAPAAETCAAARCHDGTAAFAITAACTRCHRDPKLPAFKVARPAARFSHDLHAQRAGALGACVTCHPLTRTGEVTVVGHAPCTPCHADDFGRREPTICGACHNGTEPWRVLVADRGPAERTEFGATLAHDRHPGACAPCHALTTPARQLRPPRGHRACTGTACHAVTGGAAPAISACEACHAPGRARTRERDRLAAPWSVRATFDHASHAAARDGRALACTTCHVDLGAPDAAQLATPPKATCAPCHDGAAAFKLTGTTCTRCHPGTRS